MNDAAIQQTVNVLYRMRWPLLALVVLVVVGLIWLCVSIVRSRREERYRRQQRARENTATRELLADRLLVLAKNFEAQSARVTERLRTYQDLRGQDFQIRDITVMDQGALPRVLRKELPTYQPLMADPNAARILGLATAMAGELEGRRIRLASLTTDFNPQYEGLQQHFFQYVTMLGQLNDQLRALSVKELDHPMRIWANAYLNIFDEWRLAGADSSVEAVKEQLVKPIHALGSLTKTNPFVDQTERMAREALLLVRRLEVEDKRATKVLSTYTSGQDHAARFCRLLATGLKEDKEAGTQDAMNVARTGAPAIPLSTAPASAPKNGPATILSSRTNVRGVARRKLLWGVPIALLLAVAAYYLHRTLIEPPQEASYHTGHALEKAPDHDDYDSIEEHLKHLKAQSQALGDSSLLKPLSYSLRSDSIITRPGDTTYVIDTLIPSIHKDLVPEYGIDISHYQGKISWEKVYDDTLPSPLKFVIMKASQGVGLDTSFKKNWRALDSTKVHRGAYHFFSFYVDPVKQANFYKKHVPLRPGTLRPIVDVEAYGKSLPDGTAPLTPGELRSRLQTFLTIIESHFETMAIIYSGHHYYRKHLKGYFPDNDFWLAQYSKKEQAKARMQDLIDGDEVANAIMWQFSPTGNVAGINGNVDLNYLPARYLDRVLIR